MLRRKAIPPRIRSAVIERDGMTCRYCGCAVVHREARAAHRPDHLHLDHVIPWALGGSDEVDNLVVSCATCNLARERPAHGSAAVNRLLWEREDDEYYWRDPGYRPPLRMNRALTRYLFTLEEAAELLERRVEAVIVMVAHGSLYSTTGVSTPIRVAFPDYWRQVIERRMDELGWEE